MNKKNKKLENTEAPKEKPIYEWVFFPARANWFVTILVSIFLFCLLVIVYWLTASRFFTIIGAVVLLASMRSFYFPTTYQLYEDKVKVTHTVSSISKNWSLYRSVFPERNGVFISTFTRPSRLENFRGLFLRYGDGDRDKILEIVQSKVGEKEDVREDVSSSSPGRSGEE